jgi:hypothetical protein
VIDVDDDRFYLRGRLHTQLLNVHTSNPRHNEDHHRTLASNAPSPKSSKNASKAVSFTSTCITFYDALDNLILSFQTNLYRVFLVLMLYHILDSNSIVTKHTVHAPNAPIAKSNKNASKAVFFTSSRNALELSVSVLCEASFRSNGLRAMTNGPGNVRKGESGIFAVVMSVKG